jgi:hypothetical protein
MTTGRYTDPHLALAMQLARFIAPATAVVADSRETEWASATFSGARHHYVIEVSGVGTKEALARLSGEIGEIEFQLTGHLVADIEIVQTRTDWKVSPPLVVIDVEALTVATDYRATPSAFRSAAISPAGMGLPEMLRAWRRSSAVSRRSSNPAIDASSSPAVAEPAR